MPSMDQVFLDALTEEVRIHLSEENYSVEDLANNIGMSRSQVHRKLKALTGKSISQFIREARLQKAMNLLEEEVGTASEIAYQVGFNSATYFSKCFSEYYGYPPGEVKKKKKHAETSKELGEEGLGFDVSKEKEIPIKQPSSKKSFSFPRWLVFAALLGLATLVAVLFGLGTFEKKKPENQSSLPLAVLPFTNLTHGEEDYLTEGVHEAIISELNRAGIPVKSRTTMAAFKNSRLGTEEISKKLGVSTLVEGSLIKEEKSLTLEIRLVHAKTGSYLWSQSYESRLEDIYKLYKDVTRSVADEIQQVLSPEADRMLAEEKKVDPKAYDAYLKGRYYSNMGGNDSLAVTYYQKALGEDPNFGPAYTGLVEAYLIMGFGQMDPFKAHTAFRIYAQKALELDPSLSVNHQLVAMIKIFSDLDWAGAEEELKKAIELEPGSQVYDTYCQFLWATGRTRESTLAGEKAVRADSNDHYASCDLSWAYFYDGQLDKAEAQVKHTVSAFGNECWYHKFLKYRIWEAREELTPKPNYQAIIADLEALQKEEMGGKNGIVASPWGGYGILATLYAKSGQYDKAIDIIQRVEARSSETYIDPFLFKAAYIYMGKKDKALKLMEESYYHRSFLLLYTMLAEPSYQPLRSEKRFLDLIEKMGLTPYFKPDSSQKQDVVQPNLNI